MSSEEGSQCLPSVLLLPTPVSLFSFDMQNSDNRKDLLVYIRRKKDTTNDLPLIVSLEPGNSIILTLSVLAENDDALPIALRKGERSCTNHPISNFVSYKALKPLYHTFVSSVSYVQVPSNLKEAIS